MAEAAESGQQILVRFVTPVAALRVDEAAIAVPAELNRTGLSAVVNHLRGADSEDLYEFYAVAGPEGSAVVPPGRVLLRTSLRKYLRTLGVSVEATVTLEYTPAATPPQPGPTKETTDWISAIAGSDKYIAVGQYDGVTAIYAVPEAGGALGAPLASVAGHGGVQVAAVALAEASDGCYLLATGGKDGVVHAYSILSSAGAAASSAGRGRGGAAALAVTHTATLTGAAEAIGHAALSFDPTCTRLAAGDWAGGVYVWSLAASSSGGEGDEDGSSGGGAGAPPAKRSRGAAASAAAVKTLAPLASSTGGHAQGVTGLSWTSADTLATSSMDGSVRCWEVEGAGAEAAVLTEAAAMYGPKAALCLTASPTGSLLATGHPDGAVRVWDGRGRIGAGAGGEGGASKGADGLRLVLPAAPGEALGAWVTSLSWCPDSQHHLVAATNGGRVYAWDTRAPATPLFASAGGASGAKEGTGALTKHAGQALAVGWAGAGASGLLVASGGEDKTLRTAVFAPGAALA